MSPSSYVYIDSSLSIQVDKTELERILSQLLSNTLQDRHSLLFDWKPCTEQAGKELNTFANLEENAKLERIQNAINQSLSKTLPNSPQWKTTEFSYYFAQLGGTSIDAARCASYITTHLVVEPEIGEELTQRYN
jgi:hypothetical protein